MATRAQIVTEARTWVGTRFHRHAAAKQLGCDCIGLVRGVGIACGVFAANCLDMPEIQKFKGYSLRPVNRELENACDTFARRIPFAEAKPGDFVMMRFDGGPQHLGILGDYRHGGLSLIHSYLNVREVVEHQIDFVWAGRIVAAYAFPGVE